MLWKIVYIFLRLLFKLIKVVAFSVSQEKNCDGAWLWVWVSQRKLLEWDKGSPSGINPWCICLHKMSAFPQLSNNQTKGRPLWKRKSGKQCVIPAHYKNPNYPNSYKAYNLPSSFVTLEPPQRVRVLIDLLPSSFARQAEKLPSFHQKKSISSAVCEQMGKIVLGIIKSGQRYIRWGFGLWSLSQVSVFLT